MPELHPHLGPKLVAAGFRHGFFGRVGGESQGAYSSLNCSYSVGDEPTHVALNLARIAEHLGLEARGLVTASQVHGCAVLDADEPRCQSTTQSVLADALWGRRPDYAVCVRTADCVPVLVGCRATGAALAIHAGWRGLVAGIIPAAIDRLLQMAGTQPNSLVAAIGPHIGISVFEVAADVANALDQAAPEARAVSTQVGGRPHVRLAAVALAQLRAKGLTPEQIDDLDVCTFLNEREFFSYRRDGQKSGRQLSAITPLGSYGVAG